MATTLLLKFQKLPSPSQFHRISRCLISSQSRVLSQATIGTLEPRILEQDEVFGKKSQIQGELNHSQTKFGLGAPKVYMLGWGGAVDKQLVRYSRLYEQQGYDVTRYIAPLLKAPSLVHAHPFAAEFHSAVSTNEAKNRPLIFHLFSMNGCMVFTALWELWGRSPAGRELKSRVKGIIFDSGPSDCLPSNSAIALSSTAVPPSSRPLSNVLRSLAYAGFYAYFASQRVSATLQSLIIPSRFNDYFAYYRLQELQDLPQNQLFLYSERDTIIDYRNVDRFIENQRAKGARVMCKRWSDSHHVSHMRTHEQEYSQLCTQFAKEVVGK